MRFKKAIGVMLSDVIKILPLLGFAVFWGTFITAIVTVIAAVLLATYSELDPDARTVAIYAAVYCLICLIGIWFKSALNRVKLYERFQ